jgi:uncharacterized protein (TIGR03086 family)
MNSTSNDTSTDTSNDTSTDPRTVFAHAVATAGSTIAAVRPDQLDAPTPCDQFDVRAMIGHMLVVLRRVALLGEGEDPMALPRVVTGIADDAWLGAWTSDAHRVQAAWTGDETLQRMMVLPWVTAPGAAMLAMYTSELTVHTWDLATATGQQPEWDDEVVAVALEASLRGLPSGDREAAFAELIANLPPTAPAGFGADGRPFGNPVPVSAGAAPIDQLVAWYGRRP